MPSTLEIGIEDLLLEITDQELSEAAENSENRSASANWQYRPLGMIAFE